MPTHFQTLVNGAVITTALLSACAASAADLDEASTGDFSNDRLQPTPFVLTYNVTPAANGVLGHNVVTGSTGRGSAGVDRDYLHVVVPLGYVWTELLVGNLTTSGGAGGSFIGLAQGSTMPVLATATTADGLLGWRHYGVSDRRTDILDDLALSGNGAQGFTRPLAAGDYTLWVQELSPGNFDYRFNLILSPVPEPSVTLTLLAGLALLYLGLGRGHARCAKAS